MADIYNPATWRSATRPRPEDDTVWDRRISAETKARDRLDAIFGLGREQAHAILRTDAGAKRIYDCALLALTEAEEEIARLRP